MATLTGRINRKTPPRESLLAAFDRAVAAALATQDYDALERLMKTALDYCVVEQVRAS